MKPYLEHKQNSLTTLHQTDYECKIRKEYEEKLRVQTEFWKQKSRTKWHILGDQPTTFVFKQVKSSKVGNRIRAIQNAEGRWSLNERETSEEFVSFSKNLFNPREQTNLESYWE